MTEQRKTLEKIRDLALELQGYEYTGGPFKKEISSQQVRAFQRMAQVDKDRITAIEVAARKALAALT
jgi:hypothetical protein